MRYVGHLVCSGVTFVLTFFFVWLYGLTSFSDRATDTVARFCALLGIYGAEEVLDFYMYVAVVVSFIFATLVVWLATRFIKRKRSNVE